MRLPNLAKSSMKATLLAGVSLWVVTNGAGPLSAAMKPDKLQAIDREIEAAISRAEIPGAVLRIESKGEVYEKAYGKRLVSPGSEAMTLDTIFDLASLTKVMATTPSILKLVEDGRLSLDDPVAKWIPEFLAGGVRPEAAEPKPVAKEREGITIRHLLTHQSGLPPGIFLSEGDFWGYEEGVRRAATVGLLEKPGTRFRYSDVNFILLGEIVRRVSGERLEVFAAKQFFVPLGMSETGYRPGPESLARIAPTAVIAEYGLLRGQVHDPTARRMEGIAGHAGLFGTMRDVAIYTRFFLSGKRPDGQTLLHPDTITQATANQLPAALGVARGLGWDISSSFGTQRGEKFPLTGFGHTGWTGTSIWVDPGSETFVILLTNRNHPSEAGKVKPLRARVGTLAAEAVGYTKLVPAPEPPPEPAAPTAKTAAGDPATVLNGIDVLERDGFALLKGKKVGLVTNQTGINRQRRSTIDLLADAPEVDLNVLFSPEHGIRGVLDQEVIDDEIDAATGLPVYSLYQSEKRKPTPAQLAGLDALVFDIQDIGCRFYTYVSTMGLAMEAAKEAGIRFVVLDRVNPIGGVIVDGPVRTGEGNDFVAFHEIPVQHGMTTGELARMFNAERKVGADLVVVPVEGWNPAMRFDETGLPWVNPSPNMRSLAQALLYPGVGLVEFTNVSVGRGTHSPFEHIGAPWIHDGKLAQRMRQETIAGVEVLPDRFTPEVSVYKNEDCAGVRFYLSDRDAFRPLDLGIELMLALQGMYPKTFTLKSKGNVLLRHAPTIDAILEGADRDEIRELWRPGLEDFLKRRETYLLYPRS
jgi:uncharacterized protein YbbC (DUF1343 family)/CubicO group peptidase (beta-lactamase class C family)